MKGYIKCVSILIMLIGFAAVASLASATTPNPTTITNTTGNFWVNHTWEAGTGNVTDSYNVSVNGAWYSTINKYWYNSSYSAHDWQNITVYAFNNTYGQSTGNVSQNTQIPNNQVTITNVSGRTVNEGGTVYVDYDASDADGDTPTFSCNKTDLFADFDTATGEGNWTNADAGMHYVDFGVSDGWGSTDNYTMTITVSAAADTTPPKPKDLDYTEGKYWVNYTWQSGGVGTDSYNVSMNDTWWHNGSTDTFLNTSVGPSGWANITVWAYNTSGNGNLSTGNINGSVQVQGLPSGYSTGYRIWEDDMDTTYTWDARSFTGFYYDLDTGEFTETLKITGIKETLDKNAIEYTTKAMYVDFDYSGWKKYKVIGFMAEKYFAGYDKTETDDEITDETISLVSSGMLSKVLIDDDKKHTISTGASLQLEAGYELKIIQLDVGGNKAQIELTKDGKSISGGTGIIDAPDTFVYTKDIGSVDDVPIIAIYVDSVFAGTETSMLVINGIFQISESYTSVKSGTGYGKMEITGTSGDTITMENDDEISLEKGETVTLMGDIKFLVADSSTLRFALYEEITEPGTYNIRGTVYNTTETPEWTHMNFEGFYYNIDDNIGTEELKVMDIGTSIDDGKLVYETEAQPVSFDLSGKWGKYKVIGFMAEKYFAGYYGETKKITDETINLVSSGMLSKVLIDEDKGRTVSTGASLQLEEGYELKIIQLDVSGNKAQLELIKNGKSISGGTAIVDAPNTFVYTKDLGSVDDVPIVAIYISSVFQGTETSMITIDGIFQISESYKSVKSGDDYGEMTISSTSGDKITMDNPDSVSLDTGGTTMIMGDVGFMTSENGARYCLFVRRTIGSLDSLAIEFSETPVVDEELVITVTSGGDPVEGADVTFGGENLGLTDSNGEVRFTPDAAGTFAVTASKENYDSASEDVKILTEDEAEKDALDLAMPELVDPGEEVIIRVTSDGDAVEGATITWDDEEIGETDDTGSLTYSHDETGTYTVTASKSGYLDASEKITVSIPVAKFELDGISLPDEVAVKKSFTITTNITNVGDIEGTYRAELVIDDGNGTVTTAGSENVTLAAGETGTVQFTYKIAKAGTYTVQIGGESGEIVVTPSKSKTALVAAILIILALLGGIGYVLISSTPEGGWTTEKLIEASKNLIETIKEKLPGKKGL